MLSINISKHTTPQNYELSELPAPTVQDPNDIVIKVHAASVNPIDVKKASGASKVVLKDSYVLDAPLHKMTCSDYPWRQLPVQDRL